MVLGSSVQQLALDIGLSTTPTLQSFRPGLNAPALEHLRLWAGTGAGGGNSQVLSPVPTYLWGEAGCGKTHMLRAVAASLRAEGAVVGWLDTHSQPAEAFRDEWAVVLLDDVHLFDAAQQQLAFNWFVNAMAPLNGPARGVLAAGALPPADLRLRDDLRSRLGWGHVFQLHVPDETERRAVLRQQADARGIFLGDEVMDYILHRFSRDLGSLMQLLDHLDSYALRTQRTITIPLIRAMLENDA
jgi:DnaA family protein